MEASDDDNNNNTNSNIRDDKLMEKRENERNFPGEAGKAK